MEIWYDMSKNKKRTDTQIEYEESNNGIATTEYLHKRNEEIYLNKLRKLTGNPNATFENELEWYKEQGKPIASYSKTLAIRKYCQECNDQRLDSGKIKCDIKWGKYYNEVFPEGCPFNVWVGGIRYIPKGSKKVTQKSAITTFCKWCQQGAMQEVRNCPAFLYKDSDGEYKGCWLFPYRYGKNPWHTREVTEKQKEILRNGLKKYQEKKKMEEE
jgi:hypothetical protein